MRSFGTLLLAAWTLLHLYVFTRAATVPSIARRVPPRVLFGGAAALWATFVLARLARGRSGDLVAAFELLGLHALAILFVLAVPLLAVDIGTGFGLWLRVRAPALRGWALLAGTLLVGVAIVQGVRPPVVRDHEVRLAALPPERDGTVLVVLADLHLGRLLDEAWLAARVAQVEALRPDLVVFLGDLFEGRGRSPAGLLAGLRRFTAPLGVWAVTGNHEYHGEAGDGVLEAAGFRVLHDRWAEVASGLVLAGVDDLTARSRAGHPGDPVGTALAGRPPGAVVLLSHSPLQAHRAAALGTGLLLAGHTHGGQIWPFGYLVERSYPLLGGRYEVGAMSALVSRGTGTWGPRLRLWRPGEILRVTLRSAPGR